MVGYQLKFSVWNKGDPRDVIVEVHRGFAGDTTTIWHVFFNTPKNFIWNYTTYGAYDAATGTYTAYAKAWEGMSGGIFVSDIVDSTGNVVGARYWDATGTGELFDSKTDTFTVTADVVLTNFEMNIGVAPPT